MGVCQYCHRSNFAALRAALKCAVLAAIEAASWMSQQVPDPFSVLATYTSADGGPIVAAINAAQGSSF